MASFSTYYFSSTRHKEGSASVFTCFRLAFYHSGSIALGSLLHPMMHILRRMAEATEENIKGPAAVVALCILCPLRCIEKYLMIVDSTALAFMAVSGESYSKSALNGFLLTWKHLSSFIFTRRTANTLVFFGVVIITSLYCSFYPVLLTKIAYNEYGTRSQSSQLPLLVLLYVNIFISKSFIGLFNALVTSLLICLGIDMELNQGLTANGPRYLHDKLDKIMEDANQHPSLRKKPQPGMYQQPQDHE